MWGGEGVGGPRCAFQATGVVLGHTMVVFVARTMGEKGGTGGPVRRMGEGGTGGEGVWEGVPTMRITQLQGFKQSYIKSHVLL